MANRRSFLKSTSLAALAAPWSQASVAAAALSAPEVSFFLVGDTHYSVDGKVYNVDTNLADQK